MSIQDHTGWPLIWESGKIQGVLFKGQKAKFKLNITFRIRKSLRMRLNYFAFKKFFKVLDKNDPGNFCELRVMEINNNS